MFLDIATYGEECNKEHRNKEFQNVLNIFMFGGHKYHQKIVTWLGGSENELKIDLSPKVEQ